jgi:hypothetical protein
MQQSCPQPLWPTVKKAGIPFLQVCKLNTAQEQKPNTAVRETGYKLKAAVGERLLYAEAPCCCLPTFFNKKGGYSYLGVII